MHGCAHWRCEGRTLRCVGHYFSNPPSETNISQKGAASGGGLSFFHSCLGHGRCAQTSSPVVRFSTGGITRRAAVRESACVSLPQLVRQRKRADACVSWRRVLLPVHKGESLGFHRAST